METKNDRGRPGDPAVEAIGNDRAIGGSSSGAICAFTAAWERPDAFRRVFSAIGTYVGLARRQRLSDTGPQVRAEADPRLSPGWHGDLNIYGGDWWMANQEMERALVFRRLRSEPRLGRRRPQRRARHEGLPRRHALAMEGLAATGQEPATGVTLLNEILVPARAGKLVPRIQVHRGARPSTLRARCSSTTCPTARRTRSAWTARSLCSSTTPSGDGQAFGPDGRLYAVAGGEQKILAYDPTDKGPRSPRDSAATTWSSATTAALRHKPGWDGGSPSKVWYISPKGEKKVVDTA